MTERLQIIPKGTLLVVSHGEHHCDHSVSAVFRALQDIDTEQLRAEWLALHPKQSKNFNSAAFLGWIARKGFFESVEVWDYFLGHSGYADTMEVGPWQYKSVEYWSQIVKDVGE